jgi:hypothetical protein
VFAQQSSLATCTITQYGLVVAPAFRAAVALESPSSPIEVPHGYSATFPIKVARSKGADSALAISALPLPPGLTVASTTIGAKAAEGKVTVKAALTAPLGTTTLGFQAKGQFAGSEQVLGLPAVTVTVVPPATVELAAPGIDVKPGATVQLKGKVVRKGSFNAPATVKINGLPAGLRAEPVTVAGGVSSFAIKIAADAKAPATSANTKLVLAFQVDKKDYPARATPVSVRVLPAK